MTQARLDLAPQPAEHAALAQARAMHKGPIEGSTNYGVLTVPAFVRIGAGKYTIGELTIDLDAPEGTEPVVFHQGRMSTDSTPADVDDAARAEAAQQRAGATSNAGPAVPAIDAPYCVERAAENLSRAADVLGDYGRILVDIAKGWVELGATIATVDGLTRLPDQEGTRR